MEAHSPLAPALALAIRTFKLSRLHVGGRSQPSSSQFAPAYSTSRNAPRPLDPPLRIASHCIVSPFKYRNNV